MEENWSVCGNCGAADINMIVWNNVLDSGECKTKPLYCIKNRRVMDATKQRSYHNKKFYWLLFITVTSPVNTENQKKWR